MDAAPLISITSAERQRDEMFQILERGGVNAAIRLMHEIGVLQILLPEVTALENCPSTESSKFNLLEHTLLSVEILEVLLDMIIQKGETEKNHSEELKFAGNQLRPYRDLLGKHFSTGVQAERSRRSLFILGTLLHDIGCSKKEFIDWDGKLHYYGHEDSGAAMAGGTGKRFALSNHEIEYLKTFIPDMDKYRIFLLIGGILTAEMFTGFRQIWRCGCRSVHIFSCRFIGKFAFMDGKKPTQGSFKYHYNPIKCIFSGKITAQEPFINGEQIMSLLNLKAGPELGRALKLLREEQAIGNIKSKEDAKQLLQNWSTYKRPNEKND